MINATVTCSLCAKSEALKDPRIGTKLELPKGWQTHAFSGDEKTMNDGVWGHHHFCSPEHQAAYREASTRVHADAMDEGRKVARSHYKKELKRACVAAMNVVDALATVVNEDTDDE